MSSRSTLSHHPRVKVWAGDTGQHSRLTQPEHGCGVLIADRPFLSDSFRNPAERVAQMALHSCYNCVTSTASGLNMFFPKEEEETMSLSNFGREKGTYFVDGCKNSKEEVGDLFLGSNVRNHWTALKMTSQVDPWSPLCHLFSPFMACFSSCPVLSSSFLPLSTLVSLPLLLLPQYRWKSFGCSVTNECSWIL